MQWEKKGGSAKAAAETQDWINGPNEVDMWHSGAGRGAAENRNKKKKPLYLYTGRRVEQQQRPGDRFKRAGNKVKVSAAVFWFNAVGREVYREVIGIR